MSIVFRRAAHPYDISTFSGLIPEFKGLDPTKVTGRAGEDSILLVAEVAEAEVAEDRRTVGFKLGYPLSANTFYSWIGGVSPAYRGQGIARTLLEMQEALVRKQGYSVIRVKSMNRFPGMLHLLISAHYQVVDVEKGGDAGLSKIVFEKNLV
jgi:predicted GNAT superfamily acetyltransferase